jgi:hypothetical protein
MMLPISPAATVAATPPSPGLPGESAGGFTGLLAGLLATSTTEPGPALPGMIAKASGTEPQPETALASSPEATAVPAAMVPITPVAVGMATASPVPSVAEGDGAEGPSFAGETGDAPLPQAPAAAPLPPEAPMAPAEARRLPLGMQGGPAADIGPSPAATDGGDLADGAEPASPVRAAPGTVSDATPDATRTGLPERPAAPGRLPDAAAPTIAERPTPDVTPAPPRASVEPSRQPNDTTAPSGDPQAVTATGQELAPAQRPSVQAPASAEAQASARVANAPERPLPAAGIAVLRAAEPRPVRAAAPSLSPPVSAGAVETLNAASAAADPAPLRAHPGHGPSPEPAGHAPMMAEADMPPEIAEAAPRAAAHAQAGSPPPRAPADTQGTLPGGVTQTPTGQPAAQPGLGLAGPPVTQAAASHGQATARPAPATPAQQLMPVVVTLAAGAAGSSGAVTVTLAPVELGRVEISVRTEKDARARIHVVAERPETLLLLLRDQASLDRALAQAGVGGAEGRTLSFDLAAGDGRGQGEAPARDGGGRPASPRTTAEAEAAHIPVETPRRRSAIGALDIAV